MANINFSPEISTNKIYRDLNTNRCLTDDLDNLEQNKANVEHIHTQYAKLAHAHSQYAASNHTHSGYAASSHTHQQSSISGLTTALNNKANVDHSHVGTLKTKNASPINVSGSSSFTGTINPGFEEGCTYLVSIKYASAAGLIDQSLYSVHYDASSELIPTYNLVKCQVGSDSLLLTKTSSGITYVLSLNSSNSATVTDASIKII